MQFVYFLNQERLDAEQIGNGFNLVTVIISKTFNEGEIRFEHTHLPDNRHSERASVNSVFGTSRNPVEFGFGNAGR